MNKKNKGQSLIIIMMKKVKNVKSFIILLMLLFITIISFSCIKTTKKVEPTETKDVAEKKETTSPPEMTETTEVRTIQTIKSGTYYDKISQRATMEVSFKDGIYYFDINWGSSASENTNWKFSGKFNKGLSAVAYRDCVCNDEVYDENGNCTKTEKYKGGLGIIKFDNGKLYWDAYQEEKYYDDNYNGIFEMASIDGFTNTQAPINYNITNNYYGGVPYGINGYVGSNHNNVFYIVGYDREPYKKFNGEAMITRYPIISGNNPYLVNIANGLIPNAYSSISSWCGDHLRGNTLQAYYLNYASINSYTNTMIYMTVNCALQKKGILSGNVEFRLELNLASNRYYWERIKNNDKDRRVYKVYDGENIIILD